MMPNDDKSRQNITPLEPQRHFLVSPYNKERPLPNLAAARVIRSQIDSIYAGRTTTLTPQTTPITARNQPITAPAREVTPETPNPYDRNHTVNPQPQAEQWQQYHSAWQDYYKQYYERYYANQVHAAHQALASQTSIVSVASQAIQQPTEDDSFSKKEALNKLRNQLRERVRTSATKVRKSRHFVPIMAAIIVVLAFSFLQYNRLLFATVAAYVAPGNVDPQSIIVDPNSQANVGPESKLIIPKTNVDVPIIYNVSNEHQAQMDAMVKGVMHFSIPGASSVPGQIGNMVIAGHSSNDIFDTGDYKFIFAQNDKLVPGDTIYINYNSVRYTYTVTKKEVVLPTDVAALTYKTDKPILTLITCVPLGTALKRLLITAEQVSPDPAKAAPAPDTSGTTPTSEIPGNSPTFVQRIFGAK